MSDQFGNRVTEIVTRLGSSAGQQAPSTEELFPLVYGELRRLAQRYLQGEAPGHTLQPTALVHEAYLKLVDQTRANWKGRSHFFAVGAQVMRRLLVDHARERRAQKRGGDRQRVTMAEWLEPEAAADVPLEEIIGLNRAVDKLATVDPREARIVVMRFFGGLTMEQIAAVLGLGKRTVEGNWRHARAWLRRELEMGDER
jgi:RNA polymerase sigma factor (TIGR02999 family)